MKVHPVTEAPHPDDTLAVSALFLALSNPTRVRLVHLLAQGPLDVGALVDHLLLPQSTVSRHLGLLRHAGVVTAEVHGTSRRYRLADAHVGDLLREAYSHAEHERLGLPDHPAQDHHPHPRTRP